MIFSGVWVALLATGVINLVLMALMLTANKKRIVHLWFALLTGSVAAWSFCIYGFLSTTQDITTARTWVVAYYIAAAFIPYGLFEFSLNFPRKIVMSKAVHIGLFALFLAIALMTLASNGMIERVLIKTTTLNTVQLDPAYYAIYAAYFLLLALGTVTNLLYGLRIAVRKRRYQLVKQMKVLIIGVMVSLVLGAWFNLILPLLNDYNYVWVGPLCTIIFSVAIIYATTKQGMLDLQQAVARTVVYVLLLLSLGAVYGISIVVVSQTLVGLGEANDWQRSVLQIVIMIFLALTVQPLKHFFDLLTSNLFFRAGYDIVGVADSLRVVISNEVQTTALITQTSHILEKALSPRYISVCITDLDGRRRHYNGSRSHATPHQQTLHEQIILNHLDDLPHYIALRDIDHLKEETMHHLLIQSHVGAMVQFTVQRQRVGVMFLGLKQNGSDYDSKDAQLLTGLADELALAIQNSLRFREIEQFNETLKLRVDEATSELRTSNLELQKLDEAKDEFVSMASHQLRTPLTSVKGYISMVLEGDAGKISPLQKQLLGEAFTSSERMVHLINDFLNVSRLQTGKFMLERRAIDLARVTEQEVDSLQTTAAAHSLKLKYRSPAYFPTLYVDEGKLRQVIMNFIDNAIYYSKETTTIAIKLYISEGDAVFEVHDTGIGVPEKERTHLFTKFFRATNARKQRPDGTGVGLFLAKKVIVAHGGSVVFSSVEGEGSVFGFRLPIKKLSTAAEETENLG